MKGIFIMVTNILYSLLIIIPAILVFTAVYAIKANLSGKAPRKASRLNFISFGCLALLVAVMSVGVFATEPENTDTTPAQPETASTENAAAEETQAPASDNDGFAKGMGLLAAALVTGLAGIGGGLAVAAGAPAAIAATSEDPKAFGKSIIFVALGESIALYGVVISILILQKV